MFDGYPPVAHVGLLKHTTIRGDELAANEFEVIPAVLERTQVAQAKQPEQSNDRPRHTPLTVVPILDGAHRHAEESSAALLAKETGHAKLAELIPGDEPRANTRGFFRNGRTVTVIRIMYIMSTCELFS
ncbi:hypothetical protein [Dyella sp. 333MFSha]|uniref:hypothetical protein n=1 Tax=Dyella sp. 333MFSha TaxID=1798240 RepID=UPI0021015982|nr:hypothetical protein [Dyella sp. 333MFSha]